MCLYSSDTDAVGACDTDGNEIFRRRMLPMTLRDIGVHNRRVHAIKRQRHRS
jgi:hypothetical protein